MRSQAITLGSVLRVGVDVEEDEAGLGWLVYSLSGLTAGVRCNDISSLFIKLKRRSHPFDIRDALAQAFTLNCGSCGLPTQTMEPTGSRGATRTSLTRKMHESMKWN